MAKQYVVSRRIATGGMAEVLLAAQIGGGGYEKLVVLKRVLSHLREDGQFLQMFLNEARLAALLKHPNIVEIYRVERHGDEFLVVMEYLSGEDLRYIIGHVRKQGIPMDVGVACRVIANAADALHYAHTAKDLRGKPMGIVHRDVAPANIMVTYDGTTKLLDFGIAKATTRVTYTMPGTMKGKFAYMSPEHIQQKPLDGRSDIYSLGVVLWELLSARRLFKGPNDAAILKEVMELEVKPPSTYNAAVPPELDEIVAQCLEREVDDRVQSAKILSERLQEVLTKMDAYVTNQRVGEWMRDTLPWRYHERRELERAVVREAGTSEPTQFGADDAVASNPLQAVGSIPPLFSGRRGPAGAASNPGAAGAVAAGVTGTSPSAQVAYVPPSNVSSAAGYGLPERRGSSALVVALAVSVGLLLVTLVVGGFYLFGEKAKTSSKATLFVHAAPAGATLVVDGQQYPRPVGPSGIQVQVSANRIVQVVVHKKGHLTQQRTVRSPASGVRHIYFNLPRLR